MNIDYIKLDEIIQKLIKLMKLKHPDSGYTIETALWMDNTFCVNCKSGKYNIDDLILRVYRWYNNKTTYIEYNYNTKQTIIYKEMEE